MGTNVVYVRIWQFFSFSYSLSFAGFIFNRQFHVSKNEYMEQRVCERETARARENVGKSENEEKSVKKQRNKIVYYCLWFGRWCWYDSAEIYALSVWHCSLSWMCSPLYEQCTEFSFNNRPHPHPPATGRTHFVFTIKTIRLDRAHTLSFCDLS